MSQSSGEKKHTTAKNNPKLYTFSTVPIVDDAPICVAKMVETITIVANFLPPRVYSVIFLIFLDL